MNGALSKLLLLTLVCGISLWFGVKWFVGGTNDLASTIDLRSLAHLREDYQGGSSSSPGTQQKRVTGNKMTDPVSVGLQRLDRTPTASTQTVDERQEEQDQERPVNDDPVTKEPEEIVKEVVQPTDAELSDQAELSALADDGIVPLTRSEKLEQEELRASTSLNEDEIKAREAVRRQRLEDLGLVRKKPPEPTIAVDASLEMPDRCSGAAVARVPIGLKFRFESSLIKGESLNALESLVALYRDCSEGKFILAQNPLGRTDATESLIQMRFDEIKYFFIQHSVSIDAVQFPEK